MKSKAFNSSWLHYIWIPVVVLLALVLASRVAAGTTGVSATTYGATPVNDCQVIHEIEQGETLFLLFFIYSVPVEDILAANPNLPNPDFLSVGELVKIPLCGPPTATPDWSNQGNNGNGGWNPTPTPNWNNNGGNNGWNPTPTPNWNNNGGNNGWNPTPTPNWNNNGNNGNGAWTPTPDWNNANNANNNNQWNNGGGNNQWNNGGTNSTNGAWTPTPTWNNANTTAGGPWATGNQWVAPTPTPNLWSDPSRTVINITNDIEQSNVTRFGINVGSYDQYGAAQYLKNVIPNPGFESAEFSMLFLVRPGASGNRLQPNRWFVPWNAHEPGDWEGATFEIVSGPARGRVGRVERFEIEGGQYTFYLNNDGTVPNVDDAVIVRREVPGYYADGSQQYLVVDESQRRPGSPGRQSLRMLPSSYTPAFSVAMDSWARDADASAGKLRIADGRWHFEIWARAQRPGQSLEVKFHRVQEDTFYEEIIPITTGWQKISRSFTVPVGGDSWNYNGVPEPLSFEIRIADNTEGEVWIDDVLLESGQGNNTAFTDNYVQLLRELRPGILRNWGHQLGSTLDNQLAEQFARQTVGHDPHNPTPDKWHYSIHEFFELSRAVGAEPWYVIPPTWSAGELKNFIAYLSAPAGSHPYATRRAEMGQGAPWTSVFPTIHIEFGNELWGDNSSGDPFRGSTLRGGDRVGQVAHDRLGIMRSSRYFNEAKIDLVIGGQAGFSGRQQEIERHSTNHDTIGVAPYFGQLDSYSTDAQRYYPLFAGAQQQVSAGGKLTQSTNFLAESDLGAELAIYELHSHFTFGNVPLSVRNDFLTGMNMGLALPLHMLTYQRDLGIDTQAAFTSLQYSFRMPRIGQYAKVWGMLRDSEATGRKRPTWLGVELANRAIRGNMISTQQSGLNPTWYQRPINGITRAINVPYVQSFAFRDGDSYAVVLFNLDLEDSQNVMLALPGQPNAVATLHTMTSNSIHDDNEDANNIFIKKQNQYIGQNVPLTLAPHSAYVLEWTQQ